MYFALKALLRNLALPPASSLIVAVLGALMIGARRRVGGVLLALGLGSLWLFATPFIADALLRVAERYPALDLTVPIHAQAIVVLGGGGQRLFAPEYSGPAADYGLLERLTYAAFLARKTGLPLMISGAPNEALAMQTSLDRDFGITVRWIDNHSRDTFENAHGSARILGAAGIRRIALVTSSTHAWRAVQEFRSVGFEVTPAPEGGLIAHETEVLRFVPSPAALLRSNAAMYELIGEPMRRIQAALGLRERFDKQAAELL